MKDFDNIEDWYRDELDKFNVNPDQDVWQSLSDDLDSDMTLTDDNISDWYKREVSKLEERPDYTVWEKLATKLDTTSVWDKLVVSLNRYEQFIWWRNTILKGSAILLLLGGSYVAYNNYSHNNKLSESEKTTITKKDNQLISNNDEILSDNSSKTEFTNNISSKERATNTGATSVSSTTPNPKAKNIANSIKYAKQKVNPTKRNENSSTINNELYASLSSSPKEIYFNSLSANNLNSLKKENERDLAEIERRAITEKDISHIYDNSDFLVKKEKNKIVFNSKRFSTYFTYGLYARRFYFGANTGLKKQGLITSISKDGALAKYNQTDYLDFGNNFGLVAGYILSDKINIETNLNVHSTSGYKRNFNSPENSFEDKLTLNYTTLNVLAKKMNTKSTFDNKVYSTNIIGGVYASYLRGATSNDKNIDTYKNTDFGIVLGIEQDRYITKTFIITPGVRYNQGLINAANDNNAFNSARNFSLEFNLGIKYILLKKSK